MITPDDVLDFWFDGDPSVRRAVWFEKNPEFDHACTRFAAAARDARAGALDSWLATPRHTLALLILLDQFSRNLHRGSPESYTADAQALRIARDAVAKGFDKSLGPVERMFLYLPFVHSEVLADQDEAVRLVEALEPDLGPEPIEATHRHRDVILRYGRFPHRNEVLGRISTPDEQVYLSQPGAGF